MGVQQSKNSKVSQKKNSIPHLDTKVKPNTSIPNLDTKVQPNTSDNDSVNYSKVCLPYNALTDVVTLRKKENFIKKECLNKVVNEIPGDINWEQYNQIFDRCRNETRYNNGSKETFAENFTVSSFLNYTNLIILVIICIFVYGYLHYY